MNEFGEFLYTLRKEKGLTQAALAEAVGVTNKAVSKWETGEAMPETGLLIPLSRTLGVTVDELLQGKRNTETFTESAGQPDGSPREFIKQHVFTRGNDEQPKTLHEIIGGAVCACIFAVSVVIYLLLGILLGVWHPAWALIPIGAFICGITGILFDLFNAEKRRLKIEKKENPYTGAICGIIMLLCIAAYLAIGAFANLWHPYWIIVVCGAACCIIIGAIGEIYSHKK